ncbi:MAG: pantoate--beta-alanine ligase [Actinobacteria bacterium]|nr:pantoate--beta-alanine ligase [Actinomycetota bacterium]
MGALHAGHASLFALAKKYSSDVVASIFVNPLQFENQEDLAQYPRTPDIDIAIAEAAGVTHLWLPTQAEIYPDGYLKKSAGPIGDIYEGKSRPGHFDGVLTVVNRFFELLKPKVAIFGEKDFQQLQLIKTIAGDIEIITAPTIRESDGLALSSRNVRLSEEGRNAAQVIYRALTQARSESELREILASESALTVDYADFIDEKTFAHAQSDTREVRAIVAGWINGVRLIDNMAMGNRA